MTVFQFTLAWLSATVILVFVGTAFTLHSKLFILNCSFSCQWLIWSLVSTLAKLIQFLETSLAPQCTISDTPDTSPSLNCISRSNGPYNVEKHTLWIQPLLHWHFSAFHLCNSLSVHCIGWLEIRYTASTCIFPKRQLSIPIYCQFEDW